MCIRKTWMGGCLAALIAGPAAGSEPSLVEDVEQVYQQLFDAFETRYLYRNKIDVDGLREKYTARALKASNFEEALAEVTDFLDEIEDRHTQLFWKDRHFTNSRAAGFTAQDFSASFLQKYESQPGFAVHVIEEHYGYIFMPGMMMVDLSKAERSARTQAMYDAIMDVAASHDIRGWVIDLRFNIGGNAYAMINALYPFLGETDVYISLDAAKEPTTVHRLESGRFYTGDTQETWLTDGKAEMTSVPVVLVTGKLTASAGEDVVIAFRGRDRVLVVGEPSYGLLTGNDEITLSNGVTMVLTTGYLGDRNAHYTHRIDPDVLIEKGDDFENLSLDKNIREAIRFIDEQ